MNYNGYYLSNQAGFLSGLAGLFGQPKWTDEDQLSSPTEPRTRLVKDVLRVGKWVVGRESDGKPRFFEFTAEFLRKLAENFTLAKSRGVMFNLCNGHGDQTGKVDAEKLIAPIEDVRFDGNTLYASFYVTPEQSVYLSNPARKVSCGIKHDFIDGAGNQYETQLVHVAVVDNPVIAGQERFVKLSNDDPEMEMEAEPVEGIDFAGLVDALNRLLSKFGVGKLPAEVDEDSLIVALKTLAGGDEEEPKEGDMKMSNAAAEAESAKALMTLVNDQNEKIAALSNQMAALLKEQAKGAYVSKLDALAGNGNITAAVHTQWVTLGEKADWNLSLLDGLDKLKLAPKAGVFKKLATDGEPEVDGAKQNELTKEKIESLAKSLVAN